ncbi:MAG TPA: hypothetical protein VK603_19950 [Candidatus Saccharimonadales bacterium]|nr:hypothetical protein [Candidatus Saccharimonadales bacterium]
MGRVEVTTRVTNPTNGSYFERLFLVDTGAIDCMAPAVELEKIGVARRGRSTYELADGSLKEYDWGFVELEFIGDLAAARILFDENDGEALLGVVVLESCGIVVDPRARALRRLPAIPLK